MRIWAKSKASDGREFYLSEHTEALFEQFEKLENFLPIEDKTKELIKIAIFAHDLGKVSPTFQISVGNWDYPIRLPFPDIPHSLFSILWLSLNSSGYNEAKNINREEQDIILSAVAFHHWRANFEGFLLGQRSEFKRVAKKILEEEQLRAELLSILCAELTNSNQLKQYLGYIGFNEELAEIISTGCDLLSHLKPPYLNYFLPYKLELNEDFKRKMIFTLGVLIRVDHFASYLQREGISEDIEKDIPPYQEIENGLSQKFPESFWQAEIIKDKKDKNLILVAPTGTGKTEFAFLWGAGSKLFFTLPLRSAVNAIYERSKGVFGEDKVALLHSDADVYLYESTTNYEGERMRVLDLARHLAYPVLITTGDQIFPSALKYPGYEKIYAALGYSRLVIDEVQAYDPQAVAIIVKLIEDIIKLGGKFLLMTATLPNFVLEEIEKRVGKENFQIIDLYEEERREYESLKRHRVKLCEGDLKDKARDILRDAKSGKRVLIILNTIKKAQEVYQEIKKVLEEEQIKDQIFLSLLHSRFTISDRREIESEVVEGEFKNPKVEDEKAGKILVATQVVEASLDIDADVLYTELAPMDALVQRMGRVLRRYKKGEYTVSEPNIFIFFKKEPDERKNRYEVCSGAGTVYKNSLLFCALVSLLKKAGINIELAEMNESTPKRAIEPSEAIRQILAKDNLNNKEFLLSEIDKNYLVKEAYDMLVKTFSYNEKMIKLSDYLNRFYDTLEILDAGYVSERKEEAYEIFRRIFDVPVIPKNLVQRLREEIEKLDEGINYVKFKSDILAKFVVNIDYYMLLKDPSKGLVDVSYLASYIENSKLRQKVRAWLEDIYVTESFFYDKTFGLKENQSDKECDNIF